jgi:hypothetical protein
VGSGDQLRSVQINPAGSAAPPKWISPGRRLCSRRQPSESCEIRLPSTAHREDATKPGEVGVAVAVLDRVGEAGDGLGVAVVPLHRDVDRALRRVAVAATTTTVPQNAITSDTAVLFALRSAT